MNVMYAADDNYAEIMGISILSLLENNKNIKEIFFYIVEDGISLNNIEKLQDIVALYHRNIIFLKKPDIQEKVGVKLKTLRWSDSAYSRLFLKELFNQYELDKLLYLDCDTLIVSSLQELWETDICDCLGAACLECMSNLHKMIIGAKKTDNYINTGMMLLNVKKWIEDDIEVVVSEFIKKYNGKTEYVDQGVINGTVSNQFRLVSPRYNLTTLAYDFTYEEMQIYRKPQFGYTKQEWETAVANPAVIHFTTSFLSVRPWYEGSEHPYVGEWKKIHQASPWKNMSYRKMKDRELRDKKQRIFNILPKWIAVRGAGILHAYVKPLIYKLNMMIDV